MHTLSKLTCNAIYQNADKAHVFYSLLSFQQAFMMVVCTSNRPQVTAGFVKTVACTPPENKRRKKRTKSRRIQHSEACEV